MKVIVFVTCFFILAGVFFYKAILDTPDIKQNLQSYLMGGKSTQRLQLAEIKKIEILDKTSTKTVWQMIKLPDVVVRFQTPVTYTYYIDFADKWNAVVYDDILTIKLPPLKINEPAADLSKMEFYVKDGSIFRNNQEAIDSVKPELSNALKQSAIYSLPEAKQLAEKSIIKMAEDWRDKSLVKFREVKVDFLENEISPH